MTSCSASVPNPPPPPSSINKRGATASPTPKKPLERCTSRYPRWAVDPLTFRLMTCPVVIKAPCQHVVDKSSFAAWVDQGNTVCPVCFVPMTSVSATADKELAARIQALETKNDTALKEEKQEKERDCALNKSLNWDGIFDSEALVPDPVSRFSQSENLSFAAARLAVTSSARSTCSDRRPQRMGSTISEEATVASSSSINTPTNSPPASPIRRPRPKAAGGGGGLFPKLSMSPSNSPRVVKTSAVVHKLRKSSNSPPSTPTKGSKPGIYEALKSKLTMSPTSKQKIPVLKTTIG